MPGRKFPLITGEIYHVFNRGIDRRLTFTNKREYARGVAGLTFYNTYSPPISFSKFLRLEDKKRMKVEKLLKNAEKNVQLFCYCFMPNHFHFLVKQERENGIAKFFSNFQNSYTRYFNIKHDRDGSLFLDQFKAVRIETDEQLLHVSRYIHLNPYTGFVVKSFKDLERYPWSSLPEYIHENENRNIVDTSLVGAMFPAPVAYKQFVFDQADYQRKLKAIEHLTFE